MKTQYVISLTLFFLISISSSAQSGHWGSPDDPVVRELIAMEEMWSSLSCSPQPGIEKMFAEEFQATGTTGARYGKADAMSFDPDDHDRDCILGEVKIQFFGDVVAVAYGNESSIRMGPDGKEYTRCLAWTDTWLKRNGKWQLISAQDTVVKCPE